MFKYKYALKGFSAKLGPKEIQKLKRDPRVKRVTAARMFHVGIAGRAENDSNAGASFPTETMQSGETTPWGVARVNGPLDGTGKVAWIIDSGIDLDHPDLNVDLDNSASFIAGETPDDNFGHGTYVAGILAARNNAQDLVGVAAGATVVSIKVCNENGGCPEPSLLNGIDYVSNQAHSDDIVNISIWNTGGIDIDFDDAVTAAANNGIRLVLIAGNAAANANNYSPGRVNHSNIWTISAYDDTDAFATSFSNYGNPPIDYAAPGEDVPSLRVGGGSGMGFPGTGTEDGTSYAAPHIAGLLLAAPNGITTDGIVSNDPDGNPDPIAVRDYPLSTTVGGPSTLRTGQQGIYNAIVSYEEGSVSYNWYYRTSPGQSWISTGSNSPSYTHTFYNHSGQDENHAIKVEVNSAGEVSSDYQTVRILPECDDRPGPGGTSVTPQDIEPCD